MRTVKLGFVPLHRYPFDEKWGVEIRRRVIESVSKIPGVRLIYPGEDLTKMGLVWDDDDAEKVIDFFKSEKVDGLLIGTMTFGDELAGARVAEEFKGYPIAVFGTKEPEPLPGGFRRSDSFCGTLSLTSGLYRREIPFTFLGIFFPEEDVFRRKLDTFIRATAIMSKFIGARVGLIGPRPERFETVTFNEAEMVRRFKQRVVHESLLMVVEEARALNDKDPEVVKILDEMKSAIDVSQAPPESLLKMAKLEAVLRRVAKERRLSAMGIRCWTELQKYYGISPCFVMGRLTQSGIPCSCEVDIYGALTMLIQYEASLETMPPHFIDWTIQHPRDPNTFLSWHCGNAPPTLFCPGCLASLRYHSILYRDVGVEGSYGTAEFRLKPGPVTICRLGEHRGEFKMLITRGEALEEAAEFRGSWVWVKVADLDKLYRTLVDEGFVHHASLIHGDHVEPIAEACKMLNIRTVIL
ncbi:MAG: L-fucose/L-arabinose isomerase family protein [Nitrososphaeria archaeon]|nr:L-fucose/L-arabinose isomerase family protein [Nitrososphaeria archaeon]